MPPRKSKTISRSASRLEASETPQTETTSASELDNGITLEFEIVYEKNIRKNISTLKRKFQSDAELREEPMELQEEPYEGTSLPTTVYKVKPTKQWMEAKRYTRFTIFSDTFEVGDIVFVKAERDDDPDPNAPITGWLAKVLEVRALDPAHVYLRVFWMYRPEDLPLGRQPYHGQNEVIASNYMQIIDATTVEAKATIRRWKEQEDKNEVLDGDELIWRQTLDITKKPESRQLSALPRHCIDQMPCNPDKLLIQCSNCEKWLHGPCIEQTAVRDAYISNNVEFPSESTEHLAKVQRTGRKQAKGRTAKASPPPIGLAYEAPSGTFSAEITNRGSRTVIVVTDHRPGKDPKSHEVPLKCLLCKHEIESGDQDAESDRGVAVQTTKDRGKKDSVVKEEKGE
jgi:hypothetical protein